MTQLFTSLLLTSGIGTALALVLTLLKPITRKVFSVDWHYYMWLVVLLVMILPVRLNPPKSLVITSHISEKITNAENQTEVFEIPVTKIQPPINIEQSANLLTVKNIKNFLRDKVLILSYIWLTVAVLIFLIKIISYIMFLIKIHRHSDIISCSEVKLYTNRKIKIRLSETICSPLVTGIVRPTLLLPKTDMTPEQLHNVLVHETLHLRRNDVLYKWFVSIVKCLHWFNPIIYFIGRQVNIDCEISCDLAVVKEMNEQQEKGYVETILSLLIYNNSKTIPMTTGMTGNMKTLKKRFVMIKNKTKVSRKVAVISVILAIVILSTTVFASGMLNGVFIKEDNKSITESDTELVTEKGFNMLFVGSDNNDRADTIHNDTPLYKNDSVSQSAKKGEYNNIIEDKKTVNETNSTKTVVNDSIEKTTYSKIKSSEISSELYGGFEQVVLKNADTDKIKQKLNEQGITETNKSSVNLTENYVVKDYNSEQTKVESDKNGNISLYFSVNSYNLFDVRFYDDETGEDVGSYGVFANNENAYTFIGFEKEKTYNVEVQSQTKEDWNIDGNYIIY